MEIAIISGKGGTGKSSISAAFLSLIPQVHAVDCDVDASNLYLIFDPSHEEEQVFVSGKHATIDQSRCSACGQCMELCRFDAITLEDKQFTIDEIACEGCALCYRICPSQAIELIPDDKSRIYRGTFRYGSMIYGRLAPGEENSGKMVGRLRELNKQHHGGNPQEITILDGPPGIGCPVLSTITGVDKVVVVTEPSQSGWSDLQRTVEVVRHFSIPLSVIINKCTLNEAYVEKITAWCKAQQLTIVACLPFDREMVEAMVNGQTIVEYRPESATTQQLRKALKEILGKEEVLS